MGVAALAISGHEQKAHARMLEERQTPASGEVLDPLAALRLLQNGQLVNLAVGPGASPGRPLREDGVSIVAAQVAAELGRSLGVPTELILDGRRAQEVETAATEVLALTFDRGEVVLGLDAPSDGVEIGYPAVIDFTDATGTYYSAGEVMAVHTDGRPRLTVRIRQASFVQLRRFVRVPVLISPLTLEVQATPGQWRAVRGEVVDVSLGGLGLLVDEPLSSGTRIRVEFELPGRFGDLSVSGRVVEPPGPAEAHAGQRRGAGLAHRRGVSYDPLTVDNLRLLQRALYHRQVELRRLAEFSDSRRTVRSETRGPTIGGRRSRWWIWKR